MLSIQRGQLDASSHAPQVMTGAIAGNRASARFHGAGLPTSKPSKHMTTIVMRPQRTPQARSADDFVLQRLWADIVVAVRIRPEYTR
jgi:hypothetical protein